MKKNLYVILSLLMVFVFVFAACAPAAETPAPQASAVDAAVVEEALIEELPDVPDMVEITEPENKNLILATTTSTQDSGLLDILVPMFQKKYGYVVQTVAVGSGAAIQMGIDGNADVLLVHSPAAEVKFMEENAGKDRVLIMHNDFVIVGPAADPVGVKGLAIPDALKAIYAAGTLDSNSVSFIARGDESGTSVKELGLWKKAEVDPAGEKPVWYIETGQGMGATLTIASEKAGYTLTDRATYLANKDNLALEILIEGDNSLLNVYHLMTVNPEKWPKINYQGSLDFMTFLISDEAQATIGEFGLDKYGAPLFFPDADKTDADFGL